MQARAVAAGQFDREARRPVAGVDRADARVLAERYLLSVPLPRPRLVRENGRRVLAVGGHQQRRVGEDALQGPLVVHQHVAGARAHEHLDAARAVTVDRLHRVEVVVGGAEVEPPVRHRARGGAGVLVRQRLGRHRQGPAVGHLQEAGDAPRDGRPRLGGDGALVLEARLAEVHLVVDHPREQPAARGVDDGSVGGPRVDAGDAASGYRQVALDDPAFVDDAGVDDAVAHGSRPARRAGSPARRAGSVRTAIPMGRRPHPDGARPHALPAPGARQGKRRMVSLTVPARPAAAESRPRSRRGSPGRRARPRCGPACRSARWWGACSSDRRGRGVGRCRRGRSGS